MYNLVNVQKVVRDYYCVKVNMVTRELFSHVEKIPVIKDIDAGMKLTETVRKYGLSELTVANFLKKRRKLRIRFLWIQKGRECGQQQMKI